MATTEDIARLILEADTKGFVEAEAKIIATKAALDTVTASYRAGSIGIDDYIKEGGKLQSELDEITAAYHAAGDAAKKYGSNAKAAAALSNAAFKAAGDRIQSASRGLIDLSRGVEDFATGGFLGALNNIPGTFANIGSAIGLSGAALGGLTAGVSLAATGAYVLYRNWDDVTGLFEERNPFPKAADDIEAMKDEVRKAKDELNEMAAAGSGNADELAKYNDLRKTTAETEKKIADAMERQQAVDALMKSQSKEDKERGSAFDEASAGRGPRLMADLVAAENKVADQEIAKFRRNSQNRITKLLEGGATNTELTKAQEEENQAIAGYSRTMKTGIEDLAKDLIRDLHKGEPLAVKKLRNLMNAGTGIVIGGEGFRAAFEAGQPEAKAKKKADEEAKKAAEQAAAQADRDAKKAHDDEVDRLNKQGKEGEAEALRENRAMLKEREDAKNATEKAAADGLDAREKSLKDTTLDEDAAEYAARIRAQGGDFDRNGQFRRLNPNQQRAAVANQVGRRVNSANPGLDPASRGALTDRFTEGAYQQANAQAEQARMAIAQQAEANGVNLSAQQITNAALQQALGALSAIAIKQRQEEARTQALARGLGQLNRQVRMPGQPNLPMGHQ